MSAAQQAEWHPAAIEQSSAWSAMNITQRVMHVHTAQCLAKHMHGGVAHYKASRHPKLQGSIVALEVHSCCAVPSDLPVIWHLRRRNAALHPNARVYSEIMRRRCLATPPDARERLCLDASHAINADHYTRRPLLHCSQRDLCMLLYIVILCRISL